MGLNIRLAFRFLWKNRLYSFINISGLSLGLACCFIILLHLRFETGFDKFNTKKDRIFLVLRGEWSYTPFVMADVMPDYFPEIEKTVRFAKLDWLKFYVVTDNSFVEEHDALYADSTLLDIFSISLIQGNPSDVLRSPDRIMLSESMAERHFGTTNIVGKTITLRLNSANHTFTIEAIYKDIPEQSSFHANCITSVKFARRSFGEGMFSHWGANSMQTFLLLKQPEHFKTVADRLPAFVDKYYPKENNYPGADITPVFSILPITKIHLYSKNPLGNLEPQGSITRVAVFASIAVLVLVIAVINFILLSLSLSYQRIKEFGMRKVVGATRNELVSLVSTEFLIVFLLSVQISLMLVELSIPWFKSHLGFMVYKGIFSNVGLLATFLVAVFILGYLSSLYITLNVSRIKPMESLKSILPVHRSLIPSRSILFIFQFSVMTGLMICLFIMQKQLWLLRNKDLGYRKEELLSMNVPQSINYKVFLDEVKKIPGVMNASGANYIPPTSQWWLSYYTITGSDQKYELEEIYGDFDLAETLGLTMIAGRTFSPEYKADSMNVLLNESAVKLLNLQNPTESYITRDNESKDRFNILGVFKDFHMRSLYDDVKPMAIFLSPHIIQQFGIRLVAGNNRKTIKDIERLWNRVYPDDPLEIDYVDEVLHLSYIRDDQAHSLVVLFSFLSLFIALMGLFGLSANTVERRIKETGIRKVNGARPRDILFVLSKQYLSWIIIAFCFAMPASWYAMHRWLQHFAYRTGISWWVYLVALIISVSVAFITILWQTYKAAKMNPVDALRYE